MAAHPALLAVDARALDKKTASKPDWVAPQPQGGGMANWRFTARQPDPANVLDSDKPLQKNDTPLEPDETDFTKLRWIPFMEDIFGGQKQDLDLSQVLNVAASGKWLFGSMFAVFDPPVGNRDHKNEKWKIGNRHNHVADAVRVRFDLDNVAKPLTLKLLRDGSPEIILVNEKAIVFVAAYPITLDNADFAHFMHFYDLRLGGYPGSTYDPIPDVTPPNFNTTRCTPSFFP
jgi:hypothetical protein